MTLDTKTGDTAQGLYERLGYQKAGVIPGYGRSTDGRVLEDATFFYKCLA